MIPAPKQVPSPLAEDWATRGISYAETPGKVHHSKVGEEFLTWQARSTQLGTCETVLRGS